MSTMLHDYFYQSEYATRYTTIVNDFLTEKVNGFGHISYLFDLEDLYNKIMDNMLEYCRLVNKNKENKREIYFLNTRKARLEKEVEEISKSKASSKKEYRVLYIHKGLKMESLNRIEDDINKTEDDTFSNNRRMEYIKEVLLNYYNELISTYDSNALDDIMVDINNYNKELLTVRFNRCINNRPEAEYLSSETFRLFEEELNYLVNIFKELPILSFHELTDKKLEELEHSKMKMNEVREMIDLKRDLLEHIFLLAVSDRKSDIGSKNTRMATSSKVMVDYTNMYLDSYNQDRLGELTTSVTSHIIDAVDSTCPTKEERGYARRLYKSYVANTNN